MKVDAPDQAIPKDALDSAECVAVFPGDRKKAWDILEEPSYQEDRNGFA
jgi:hypothetical protein